VKFEKKEVPEALADDSKAIELDPKNKLAYANRAYHRRKAGNLGGSVVDWHRTIEIDSKYARGFNGLAWLYATATQDAYRDGAKALRYAHQAVALTRRKEPNYMDTLAAAYAAAGNFTAAARWQRKALAFPAFVKSEGEGGAGALTAVRST